MQASEYTTQLVVRTDFCSKSSSSRYTICTLTAQGDRERELGIPISYLMDRHTINLARAQVGFIDVIVGPMMQAASVVLPRLQLNVEYSIQNKEKWNSLIDSYQQRFEQKTVDVNHLNSLQMTKDNPGEDNSIANSKMGRVREQKEELLETLRE